jgi:hypothetical protein
MHDRDSTKRGDTGENDAAQSRRGAQEELDPSGHGMQVTPRQQQQISNSSDPPPDGNHVASEFSEETLDDLKNEPDPPRNR